MKITVELNGVRRDFGEFDGSDIREIAKQIILTYEGSECGAIQIPIGGAIAQHFNKNYDGVYPFSYIKYMGSREIQFDMETGKMIS